MCTHVLGTMLLSYNLFQIHLIALDFIVVSVLESIPCQLTESLFETDLDAGRVGFSLTYAMAVMVVFQWMVRQSSLVENQVINQFGKAYNTRIRVTMVLSVVLIYFYVHLLYNYKLYMHIHYCHIVQLSDIDVFNVLFDTHECITRK